MSIFSRLNPFSRGPKSRPIAERLGDYEPPEHAQPWEPSERPPELPWEQDENGSGAAASSVVRPSSDHGLGRPVAEDPGHAGAPADPGFEIRARTDLNEDTPDDAPDVEAAGTKPVYLDDFRSDDERPTDWVASRFG